MIASIKVFVLAIVGPACSTVPIYFHPPPWAGCRQVGSMGGEEASQGWCHGRPGCGRRHPMFQLSGEKYEKKGWEEGCLSDNSDPHDGS